VSLAVILTGCSLSSNEARKVAVGFNDNAVTEGVASPERTAQLLAGVGAKVDRVQINWGWIEPEPGRLSMAPYDAIYKADLARGIRPLFNLAFAPPWAAEDGCDASRSHCPPSPRHYDDAARTAAAIASRFPKSAGIEIWNEPNTPHFWAPRADPVAYARLLAACYAAIKKAVPSMRVAGGSMSSSPFSDAGYVFAPDFLRRIYETEGRGVMDVLSVHDYPEPGDASADSGSDVLEQVRSVRDEFGDAKTPIWITETGISTTGDDAVPGEVQALVLLRLYEQLSDEAGVTMVLFHTLVDSPRGPDDAVTGYGIVRRSFRPKPAYCALSAAWGGRAC
jgi:hypothetical protein